MITALYSDISNRAFELAGRTRDKIPPSEAVMMQGFIQADLQDVWNKLPWPDLTPDPISVAPNSNRQFSKGEGNAPLKLTAPYQFTANANSTDGSTAVLTASATIFTSGQVLNGAVVTGGDGAFIFDGTFTITADSSTTFHYTLPSGGIIPIPPFGSNGLTVTVMPELGDVLGVFTANPNVTTRYRDIEFEEGPGVIRILESLANVFVEFMLPRPDISTLSGSALSNFTIPARFSNYLAMRGAGLLLNSDGMNAQGGVFLGLAERALSGEMERVSITLDRRRRAHVRVTSSRPKIGAAFTPGC